MSRADYAHWNEDADYMWWNEEGKHVEEPPSPEEEQEAYGDYLDAQDAFAEDISEYDTAEIKGMLDNKEYLKRWPYAEKILREELKFRDE